MNWLKVTVNGEVRSKLGEATENFKLQRKFMNAVKDLDKIHNGTINLHLDKNCYLYNPEYIFPDVMWKNGMTETFLLFTAQFEYKDQTYNGYIYRPISNAALANQEPNKVELLMPKVPEISRGERGNLMVPSNTIVLF